MKKKIIATVNVEPSDAIMSLVKEVDRLKGANEMQSKRIDWTVGDNVRKAMEIDRLLTLRLKDVEEGENAMRVLIEILSNRADIIRNAQSAAKNWMNVALRLGRKNKILESKIRHDDRHWSRFV